MSNINENQKCFAHFSSLFYKRETQMVQVLKKSNLQTSFDHFSSKDASVKDMCLKFVKSDYNGQLKLLKEEGYNLLKAFCELIEIQYQNDGLMKYFLVSIDGIICQNRQNIQIFKRLIEDSQGNKNIVESLWKMLSIAGKDLLYYDGAAKILSMIISELDSSKYIQKQKEFLELLISLYDDGFKSKDEIKISDTVFYSCCMFVLKDQELLNIFILNKGIEMLMGSFEKYGNELQTMYYVLFSLWLVSFSEESYSYFTNPQFILFKNINNVIQRISRDKIIRVSFNIFRNLCENYPKSIENLIDSGLQKTIDNLRKTNIQDEQIKEDIDFIEEILEKNRKILSSFEKYVKEINTEQLDWTPCHSEKFWRENVKRFEEQDFYLIRKLVLLIDSNNEKTVAVACYDLGEFCRFHNQGRGILDKMGAKPKIMLKAQVENQIIKENALMALQKLMIKNWQMI